FPRLWDVVVQRTEKEPDEAALGDLRTVLFLLIQDRRNRFLHGDCPACGEVDLWGVPLGRVWLHSECDSKGRRGCKIDAINTLPPYRRPFHRDERWPAPAGDVNLCQVLWLGWDQAQDVLRRLGFDEPRKQVYDPSTKSVADFRARVDDSILTKEGHLP